MREIWRAQGRLGRFGELRGELVRASGARSPSEGHLAAERALNAGRERGGVRVAKQEEGSLGGGLPPRRETRRRLRVLGVARAERVEDVVAAQRVPGRGGHGRSAERSEGRWIEGRGRSAEGWWKAMEGRSGAARTCSRTPSHACRRRPARSTPRPRARPRPVAPAQSGLGCREGCCRRTSRAAAAAMRATARAAAAAAAARSRAGLAAAAEWAEAAAAGATAGDVARRRARRRSAANR